EGVGFSVLDQRPWPKGARAARSLAQEHAICKVTRSFNRGLDSVAGRSIDQRANVGSGLDPWANLEACECFDEFVSHWVRLSHMHEYSPCSGALLSGDDGRGPGKTRCNGLNVAVLEDDTARFAAQLKRQSLH